MNIFVVDQNPVIAAQNQCDKLVVKMILETAQLLCTTFHLQGIDAPYRKTHANHPSAIWARASKANFEWLVIHAEALSQEYTVRYGKVHKTDSVISWVKENKHLLTFDSDQLTEFSVAIAQDKACRKVPNFDSLSVVEKYRWYYVLDKPFAVWQHSATPKWFSDLKKRMSEALKYIRAHQYLYYCTGFTVVSDHEYDMWSQKNCPEDYKGGSDSESSYSDEIKQLAKDILSGKTKPFPF